MAKVTIVCLMASTVILLINFGQGISILHGGSVASHLSWSMATLLSVLTGNFIAMIHAGQSQKIIRALRARLESESAGLPDDAA